MNWFQLRSSNALDGQKISLPAVPNRGNLVQIGGVYYQVMNVIFVDAAALIFLEIEAI